MTAVAAPRNRAPSASEAKAAGGTAIEAVTARELDALLNRTGFARGEIVAPAPRPGRSSSRGAISYGRAAHAKFAGFPRYKAAHRKSAEGVWVLPRAKLVAVLQQATDLCGGDRAAALTWLRTPQFYLGGVSPLAYLRANPRGFEKVGALAFQLAHGVVP